jgi:acetyl-CoA C-acetyltransferase
MDVAIVGAGIHPFGRHEGVSGRTQGAIATRAALADAGIGWRDVQFAFGGSAAAGNADSLVNELGLTGLQFVNVSNGCATGGSALAMAATTIESGAYDLGVAIGFDKHPRGPFNADPKSLGLGQWYGETGLMLTTQFFALKAQRYLHDYGISRSTLAKVAAKAYRNGSLNPNAWRRTPMSEADIAGEGAIALVLARADRAREYTDRPIYLRSVSFRTRQFGSFEVFNPWLALQQAPSPSVDAAALAFEQAGIGPDEIDLAQVQDTEAGAEVMHLAETGLCKDGEQEALIQSGATEINGSLPINTDGGCIANGEPIGASGLRQVYENVLQLRGAAGERQVPNEPKTAFTHVYGAPGLSACTVLSR